MARLLYSLRDFVSGGQSFATQLVSWPIPLLLVLQVCLALYLDVPTLTRLAPLLGTCLIVAVCLGRAHQSGKLIALSGVLIFSATLFLTNRHPLSQNINNGPATYEAEVVQADNDARGLCRAIVDLTARLAPFADTVRGRIQLNVPGRCEMTVGTVVHFRSSIKPVLRFRNPGVFDARAHQRRQDVWGRAHVEDAASLSIIHRPEPGYFDARRGEIRKLIHTMDARHPDLVAAFVLGNDTIMDSKRLQIRDAGLMHLFAISGMNFSVMAALAFVLVSFMTRLMTRFLLFWPRQKIAAALTQIFVIYYALLVEPTPSVVRAAIMIGVYLAAILLERQRSLPRLILIAAAVELFFRPLDLFSVSFHLTYLCVLILALIGPVLEAWLRQRRLVPERPRALLYAARLLVASLLLSLLLLPLVLMDFGSSPVAGILNNVWAIPLFDFALVPAALFFVATQAVGGWGGAQLFLLGIDKLLNIFMHGVTVSAALGLPQIAGVSPHLVHVLIFYVGIFWLTWRPTWRWLIVWLIVLSASLGWTAYQNWYAFDLRITQIDVGQGDAVLVQTPAHALLIDTGGHRFVDTGTRVLVPVLRALWVTELDTVVITHPDLDHQGGLMGLLREFPVREILTGPAQDRMLIDALNFAQSRGVKVTRPEASFVRRLPDGTRLHFLTPLPALGDKTSDNDRSLILRVEKGPFAALLTGDLSIKGETVLLDQYAGTQDLNVDYLKVGHHGSRSSSGGPFLEKVSPVIAVLGVGELNHYGHPTAEVLARLVDAGATIFRTDRDGAIQTSISFLGKSGFVAKVWGFTKNRGFTFYQND